MDRNGAAFYSLTEKFPLVSELKLKAELLVGPQIQHLIKDVKFKDILNEI